MSNIPDFKDLLTLIEEPGWGTIAQANNAGLQGAGLQAFASEESTGDSLETITMILDENEYSYEVKYKDDKMIVELENCPFNPEHEQSGFVSRANGSFFFKCFHASCKGYNISDAIQKISGSDEYRLLLDPMEQKLEEINQNHAVVNLNGKFAILNEIIDPVNNWPIVNFSKLKDFHDFQENNKIINSKDKMVKVSKTWIQWEKRREYKGVIFEPSKNMDSFYNLYRGFPVEPDPGGDCSLFLDHIKNVIADGNQEIATYIISWMADAVQNPGGPRPGTAIAFRGAQGCGKGTLVNNFGKIFGPHYLHLSSSQQLTGRFNDHLKSAILVFADEAVWGGDKAAEGRIKAMITEPTLFIEPKGVNGFQVSNHIRLMLASNNDWIVPAGLMERRFLVVDVSSAKIGDHQYFTAIENQMANGGIENLLHYLMQFDLSGINLRKIPRTKALLDQITASMTPFEKFWFDRLNDGVLFELAPNQFSTYSTGYNFIKYPNDWPSEFPTDYLFTEFLLFCKNQKTSFRPSKVQMGIALEKICHQVEKVRKPNGNREYCYQIPSLEKCREEFEKVVGNKIEWECSFEQEDENIASEISKELFKSVGFKI